MSNGNHRGYLFSEGGIHCPICGGRMSRGSFFCRRCRRHGRLHLDADGIKAESKEIFLPRGMLRSVD